MRKKKHRFTYSTVPPIPLTIEDTNIPPLPRDPSLRPSSSTPAGAN